jgi:hypothetical protein
MYPLFDVFTGFKNGDMSTAVEIRIPVKGENNYKIKVECLG